MTSLESFPDEILIKIVIFTEAATYLDHEFYSYEDTPSPGDIWCEDGGVAPLASTSWRLRQICLPILFSKLVVVNPIEIPYGLSRNLQRLRDLIRQRQRIAPLILSIDFVTVPDSSFKPITHVSLSDTHLLLEVVNLLPKVITLPKLSQVDSMFLEAMNVHPSVNTIPLSIVAPYFIALPSKLPQDRNFLKKVKALYLEASVIETGEESTQDLLEHGIRAETFAFIPGPSSLNVLPTIDQTGMSKMDFCLGQLTELADIQEFVEIFFKVWHSGRRAPSILFDSRTLGRRWHLGNLPLESQNQLPFLSQLVAVIKDYHGSNPMETGVVAYSISRIDEGDTTCGFTRNEGVQASDDRWNGWTVNSLTLSMSHLAPKMVRRLAQVTPLLEDLCLRSAFKVGPKFSVNDDYNLAESLRAFRFIRHIMLPMIWLRELRDEDRFEESMKPTIRPFLDRLSRAMREVAPTLEQVSLIIAINYSHGVECRVKVRKRGGEEIETSVCYVQY